MNHPPDSASLRAARPVWALASQNTAVGIPLEVQSGVTPPVALGKVFARLIGDESALYAITRDWRYDAAGRNFVRLHALLDEQFTEIGLRLVRLAERSRALDLTISTGPGNQARHLRAAPQGAALEGYMIRELLDLHVALLKRLGAAKTMTADRQFYDSATTELLAILIAEHEKDAFMLRALLWEVRNTAT